MRSRGTRASLALLSAAWGSAVGCSAGLPKTFQECGASICEVDLAAFTSTPESIPYCAPRRQDAVSCGGGMVLDGTCGGLYVVRTVYGFPGDFYDCVYDDVAGDLVGAKWAPDSHPTQVAGELPPASCAVTHLPCA